MTLAAKQGRKKPSPLHPVAAREKRPAPEAADLLAWYDQHRRALPWRARPGERADPYRVWLSEIMLQQTTVKAVTPYYTRFLRSWPDLRALAAASLEEVLTAWAGLGYYARARNMHACACALVEQHGGEFPASELALRKLPGIGGYTAAAIAAIAFDQIATPVDGNIERVIARLYALPLSLPAGKAEIARCARTLTPRQRAGDFAQAMMDLGATKPNCFHGARLNAKGSCAAAPLSSCGARTIACSCARVRRVGSLAAWPKCRRRSGRRILMRKKRCMEHRGSALRKNRSHGERSPAWCATSSRIFRLS
jgi:A/G-specific adenine glycosylase